MLTKLYTFTIRACPSGCCLGLNPLHNGAIDGAVAVSVPVSCGPAIFCARRFLGGSCCDLRQPQGLETNVSSHDFLDSRIVLLARRVFRIVFVTLGWVDLAIFL